MTQIISSYPFVHGLWNVTNPVFKRNVLMKPSRMASWARKSGFTSRLTFSCLLTKNQIAKLCSVINGVLEVGPMNLIHTQSKHAACGYELSLQSERLSQTFNTKNSLSTIESQILQHIKCSITEDSHSFYSHTTKPISQSLVSFQTRHFNKFTISASLISLGNFPCTSSSPISSSLPMRFITSTQ